MTDLNYMNSGKPDSSGDCEAEQFKCGGATTRFQTCIPNDDGLSPTEMKKRCPVNDI